MGGPCRLLSWTRIYALPEGIDRPSLAFGIVEFDNGLRAAGQLMVADPKSGARLVAKAGAGARARRPGFLRPAAVRGVTSGR